MSSPSLSDSTSTFKVDCKIQIFEKFFTFSSFFHLQHGNLLNQRTAQVGFYIIPLCLGQGLEMSFQKGARSKNKMEDKIQLQVVV